MIAGPMSISIAIPMMHRIDIVRGASGRDQLDIVGQLVFRYKVVAGAHVKNSRLQRALQGNGSQPPGTKRSEPKRLLASGLVAQAQVNRLRPPMNNPNIKAVGSRLGDMRMCIYVSRSLCAHMYIYMISFYAYVRRHCQRRA